MVGSPEYTTMHKTLAHAEMHVLRALGFHLRPPLALDHLPRMLERAMTGLVTPATASSSTRTLQAEPPEDYDRWTREEQEEYGVVSNVMETSMGRACRALILDAYAFIPFPFFPCPLLHQTAPPGPPHLPPTPLSIYKPI